MSLISPQDRKVQAKALEMALEAYLASKGPEFNSANILKLINWLNLEQSWLNLEQSKFDN